MAHEVSNADQAAGLTESVTILLAGAAVGALAAILFAPQAGRETRKQLSEYGRRAGDTMGGWAKEAYDLFASSTKPKATPAQEESAKHNERDQTISMTRSHMVAP
ncbi:MAG: YtxH domain-containing protein [Nitrospirales bacterium]|nr:YtxH domain-containing protein [Nitrospirales bacterium]